MPYRAPELFDVKTGTTINGKVDIWSVDARLVGKSPFEAHAQKRLRITRFVCWAATGGSQDEGPQEIKRVK